MCQPRSGEEVLMPTIHPKARTTPAVRAEIARSREPTGVLAQRYSVSTETIRKWRKRGPADCQDHSSRPHKLPWKAMCGRPLRCKKNLWTAAALDRVLPCVRPLLRRLTGRGPVWEFVDQVHITEARSKRSPFAWFS